MYSSAKLSSPGPGFDLATAFALNVRPVADDAQDARRGMSLAIDETHPASLSKASHDVSGYS